MKFEKLANDYGLILTSSNPEDFYQLGRKELRKELDQHGILLFRGGANFRREHFLKLSQQFSSQFIIHGAKVRRPMSEDGTVQTVTEGPDAIVLHSEMHFSPFSPDYMWFFCETAPNSGGETTVCDGELFFRNLSDRAQDLLIRKKLRYWNLWDSDVWKKYFSGCSEQEVIDLFAKKNTRAWFNQNDELEFEVTKSALSKTVRGHLAFVNAIAVHHQYNQNLKMFEAEGQPSKLRHRISFEDNETIPSWMTAEIAQIEKKLVLPLKWQNGDLALLDNNRVLHGRNAFDPAAKRTILVRMAMTDQTAV